MREIRTVLVCASIYFTSCNTADQELHFKSPTQLDSSVHQTIKTRFKLSSLDPAPSHWGGLKPAYPISSAFSLLYEDCREPKWVNQGMITGCSKVVIKKDTSYVLIGTRDELQQVYAPITDKQEALSYASIYFDYFPITTYSFFKKTYIYKRSTMISSADSLENYFIVYLYDKKVFGCGPHPYYSVAIKVFRDGSVQELQKSEAFRNPEADDLCVD
ncbi:hypothetical protein [Hymenobacter lucidus]|uniref:Lipoprotein n=1 Tax=Hymenobacter lucidus TaxID=2880930 RepID=A0ABS8AQY4_9BACT|nr:hypothetical protein [Hymenobacter lucidus]MCB2408418.1 hypothetical protein [Hymenobacter lucidus]